MINNTNEKTEKTTMDDGDEILEMKTMNDGDVGGQKKRILTQQQLEDLKRAQIERNNEWIEKMSPVVKYKIQEYVRKQRAKKMQRRKFSLACGLMSRVKQEPPSSGGARKRNRRVNSAMATTTSKKKESETKKKADEDREDDDDEEMKTAGEMKPTATVTHRRKSAPVRMDMRDLDDLE